MSSHYSDSALKRVLEIQRSYTPIAKTLADFKKVNLPFDFQKAVVPEWYAELKANNTFVDWTTLPTHSFLDNDLFKAKIDFETPVSKMFEAIKIDYPSWLDQTNLAKRYLDMKTPVFGSYADKMFSDLAFDAFNLQRIYEAVEGDEEAEQEYSEVAELIITEGPRIQNLIQEVYRDEGRLLTVQPYEFEEMIAELLHAKNFEVKLTKRTRDNGYDIIALQEIGGLPFEILVECKRYTKKPVGVEIIRSFSHVIDKQNANKGLIVTSSYFTKDATREAKIKGLRLELKDRIEILKWVKDYVGN
jgi:restriction system protein